MLRSDIHAAGIAKSKRSSATSGTPKLSSTSVLSEEAWKAIGRSLRVTRRELEIVRSVFDDRKELAIADELGISAHTVHTHIQRLHKKLGVVDRISLAVRILNEFFKLTLTFPVVLPPICAIQASGRCPLLGGPASGRKSSI